MDKKNRFLITSLSFFLGLSLSLYPAGELKSAINKNVGKKEYLIKTPTFTHVEKETSRLVKIKTIKPGANENYFLGLPSSFSMDEDNNLYVYDNFNSAILKFDKGFKFIKAIGSKGNKEGQFSEKSRNIRINTGREGNLYAADPMGKKIISFSGSGNYINQHKVFLLQTAPPVVDHKGNFYMPSIHNGIIDVYDKSLKLQTVFLDVKYLNSFLIFEPPPNVYRSDLFPTFANVARAVLSNGRLAVYLHNSSRIFLIKNDKILLDRYLWPKNLLRLYKAKVENYRKKYPEASRYLFIKFFVDRDDDSFFYLHFGKDDVKNLNLLYKFSFNGDLIKVLYFEMGNNTQNLFKLKKGNEFIAVDSNKNINIFKEN